MGTRGVISDKWSMRVLWFCALGSAIGLYMVAVERQTQNRERMLAEALKQSGADSGEDFALYPTCVFCLIRKLSVRMMYESSQRERGFKFQWRSRIKLCFEWSMR
ncbi:hypothetical protein CsSME_00026423 [Camellia sinensis var. sinensis]